MSNLDYKEGRGDYYRDEGLREERKQAIRITKRQLTGALRDSGIAPIGMSYENAANLIWNSLTERLP